MPTYDYFCPANDRTVSVFHSMQEKLATWGELCAKAQLEPGDTPATTPVTRQIGAGLAILRSSNDTQSSGGSHSCCCGHGGCSH